MKNLTNTTNWISRRLIYSEIYFATNSVNNKIRNKTRITRYSIINNKVIRFWENNTLLSHPKLLKDFKTYLEKKAETNSFISKHLHIEYSNYLKPNKKGYLICREYYIDEVLFNYLKIKDFKLNFGKPLLRESLIHFLELLFLETEENKRRKTKEIDDLYNKILGEIN